MRIFSLFTTSIPNSNDTSAKNIPNIFHFSKQRSTMQVYPKNCKYESVFAKHLEKRKPLLYNITAKIRGQPPKPETTPTSHAEPGSADNLALRYPVFRS